MLVAVVVLVLSAGCLENQPEKAVQATAPQAQPFQSQEMEGRYTALKPLGQPLQEEGGSHSFEVPGWKLVTLTLDSTIEVDVFLLPPGCASSDEPCAFLFAPGDDVTQESWMVERMEPGTWTVGVEADAADYSYVDGSYTISFEYLLI